MARSRRRNARRAVLTEILNEFRDNNERLGVRDLSQSPLSGICCEARVSKHAVAEHADLGRSGRLGGRGRRSGRRGLDPSGTSRLNPPPRSRRRERASRAQACRALLRLRRPSGRGARRASASGSEPTRPASQTAASPVAPAFDVVNVDPSGDAVIAGRAAPNAKVELRDAGKTVAEATADAVRPVCHHPAGRSRPAITASRLAANDDEGGSRRRRSQSPSRFPRRRPRLASPSRPRPSRGDACPSEPPMPRPRSPARAMRTLATPAPADGSRVAIHSVEADARRRADRQRFGRAERHCSPLSQRRRRRRRQDASRRPLVADDQERHESRAATSCAPTRSARPARRFVASANTPFDYPDASARAADCGGVALRERRAQTSAPSPADPVIESVQTKRVATGHTLWELSRNYYGDPTRYPEIYEANKWEIHNPNLIYPGQVFVVPKSEPKP